MAGFYVLNISPSRSQTHPNLPKGKGQVTLPMISANEHQPPLGLKPILTFPKGRNKLLCLPTLAPPNLPRMITHPNLPHGKGQAITKPNCFQPPPSLPRRGGTVTIAIDKRLIIRQLQMIIRQYSTANGICPSPSGEARWGQSR